MNRHLKNILTSFLGPFLISGILLQNILPPSGYAASTITSTITPDGTLGTTVTHTGKIYDINGGTIKGANLFESFSLFNLGTGDTANFNGPTGVENIVSRVTGGQQSFRILILTHLLQPYQGEQASILPWSCLDRGAFCPKMSISALQPPVGGQ